MNLINKMNRVDKQQVNDLVHCKVSLFKTDLIEQLRRLIETDELVIENGGKLLELNLKELSNQRARLSVNKRKFSSSEDEEHDKLDSNSNSLESKSDSHEPSLSLNRLLNSWTNGKEPELKCDERLSDGEAANRNATTDTDSTEPDVVSLTTNDDQHFNYPHPPKSSPKQSSESIEKSFNETFSCLNGVSVQLVGNIKLQLTASSQNSTSSSLTDHSSTEKLLFDKPLNKPTSDSDSLVSSESKAHGDKHSSTSSASSTKSNGLQSLAMEIDLQCRENSEFSKSFDIDKLIKGDCSKPRTFGIFSANDESNSSSSKTSGKASSSSSSNKAESKTQQLVNQLSASTDSSSSTLSAVSVDLQHSASQQPSATPLTFDSSSRRQSSGSTASACSDRDCLSPPKLKHLKTDSSVSNPLSLITSPNNHVNLEPLPSPYLSPLPQSQQLIDLLSPLSDTASYKTKKSHLKLDRSIPNGSNDKSPNYHKKFNSITPPKTTLPNAACSTPSLRTTSSTISHMTPNYLANQMNQLHNAARKPATSTAAEIAMNPKMKRLLKSYQEMASNSLNGPEYYENLAMLANFHQQFNMKTLDPLTAKVASASQSYFNGNGPFPNAERLMNDFSKMHVVLPEDAKSEITKLSINNLANYLTKKPELIENRPASSLPNKHSQKQENGKLETTILEGTKIWCFNDGGEKRLCLPQILTTVLGNFSLSDINNVCDQFQINCRRCNAEQLNVLKAKQILPPSAPSCGLITKSDAERLCAMLFFYSNLVPNQLQAKIKDPFAYYSDNEKTTASEEIIAPKLKSELKESQFLLSLANELPEEIRGQVYEDQPLNRIQKIMALKSTLSFKVEHHCFGKCKGLLIPAFYLRYSSRCILCLECESLLSPNKFVCHTHSFNENQTVHWGFDSSNWRNLITLTKDDQKNPKMSMLKSVLHEFKFHKIVD